jgi:hypothetical protein
MIDEWRDIARRPGAQYGRDPSRSCLYDLLDIFSAMLGTGTVLAVARFARLSWLVQPQQYFASNLFYDTFNCLSIVLGHYKLGTGDPRSGIGKKTSPLSYSSIVNRLGQGAS